MTQDESLPALSAAEMQTTREYLGLSTKWISEKLVLNERRLVRMENGQEPVIPPPVIKLLDDIYETTRDTVERMTAVYRRKVKAAGDEPVILKTYRTDAEYTTAGGIYPSRWHRHVCARVAESIPSIIIMHTTPGEIIGFNEGERLTGTVTGTNKFGAFVELEPGKDGLIHVSRLDRDPTKRIDNVDDYVRRGDQVDVEIVHIHPDGRIDLKLINE